MDEFGREEVNFIVAGLIGVFFFRFIRLRMIVVQKRTVVVFVFLLESSLSFVYKTKVVVFKTTCAWLVSSAQCGRCFQDQEALAVSPSPSPRTFP